MYPKSAELTRNVPFAAQRTITCSQKEAILSQQQNTKQFNYLHNKGKQSRQHGPLKQKLARSLPDQTVHHPPGAMFLLGGLGILFGFGANLWQMVTTFTAFWSMFNPKGTPVDPGKQPAVFAICGLIALSFQFALMMLTFRLDTTWKKYKVVGQPAEKSIKSVAQAKANQVKATAVEVVQHVNLVMVWGGLGFVVDTIGDYTFIAIYTVSLDFLTSTFIIFCYAVGLYALSTIAFVRSIEYLWAGFAAADNLKQQNQQTNRH